MRALALAAVLIAGCGARQGPAIGSGGGWLAETAHVRLRGDVRQRRAIDLAWRLEIFHLALARVFPGCRGRIDPTLEVVVRARQSDYQRIAPRGSGGFFLEGSTALLATPPRVVVPLEGIDEGRVTQVFVHELTHRFVAACYPDAPTWLHEGIAAFFETLRVLDGEIVVGVAPFLLRDVGEVSGFLEDGQYRLYVPRARVPRPTDLLEMTSSRFYHQEGGSLDNDTTLAAYAGAWALVHLMMLGPHPWLRDLLRDYLARIELGREEVEHALEHTLPEEALDTAFEGYLRGDRRLVRRVRWEMPTVLEPRSRATGAEEENLLWAELLARRSAESNRAEITAHLEAAMRSRDTRARALLLRASRAGADDVPTLVERARDLAPDDRDVLRASGIVALKSGGEGAQASARGRLEGRSDLRALDRVVLADLATATGDPETAIVEAEAAVDDDPSLAEAHFALARALVAAGRAHDAGRELRIVISSTAWRRPALAAAAERVLEELEAR